MIEIAMMAFEDVEELDLVGPWEVFGVARELRPDAFDLRVIAKEQRPLRARKGLVLTPDAAFEAIERVDLLVIPGGQGSRRAMKDDAILAFVRRIAPRCRFVMSVCTGALILQASGVADGAVLQTHRGARPLLDKMGATLAPEGARFARDGDILSAGGVSAGIDLSLWLLGQLTEGAFARAVIDEMEYWPEPPYGEAA